MDICNYCSNNIKNYDFDNKYICCMCECIFCDECVLNCLNCFELICKSCKIECETKPYYILCENCVKHCSKCENTYCHDDDNNICQGFCKELICNNCSYICGNCFNRICKYDIIKCKYCNIKKCNKCYEECKIERIIKKKININEINKIIINYLKKKNRVINYNLKNKKRKI